VRRARSDDIARIAYLINELPGYDNLSISVTADDTPEDQFSLSRFYTALKHCLKPVMGSAPNLEEYEACIRLGALLAGDEASFRERPLMTFIYCALVSPLSLDQESTGKLLRYTQDGIPSFGVVAPTAGVSAPFTLTGTLALANAEFLAQAVLEQMVRPGKPAIYCVLPTATDIRTGNYAPGAIETSILAMGCAQMARYYQIPSGGFIGQTNAKSNNAQSGYETGLSAMAALLAGFDLIFLGGLLDSLMVFDYAKAVIDNEIALMLKQTKRGMQFRQEDLALDVISEVGPGGMYMDHDHTLERMRTTTLLTEIADRSPWDQWKAQGKPEPQNKAMERVHQILASDNPAAFSPDVDARIRTEFNDLVTGDFSSIVFQ
jgi:trimethylamine--corrinoid protein Co-methyltransferase